jgi:hypothetical protein
MVTRTVIITTPEQEKAFDDFVKSNHITVKSVVSPGDLALGIPPQMTEEDWDQYFQQYPVSKTGNTAKDILHKLD